MATLANITHRMVRNPGDPRVEAKGPGSLTSWDQLARGLGWFSFGLGAAELVAPGRIAKSLGLDGKEWLIRAYGAREIAAGIPTLSMDKQVGLASRIAGDAIDLATLAPALRRDNPKRRNAMIATAAVAAVTALDIAAFAGVMSTRRRTGQPRDYSDRSGLPKGVEGSRGIARRDFETPPDMRAEPVNMPPSGNAATSGRQRRTAPEALGTA